MSRSADFHPRRRARQWITIVAIAVGVHLLLLLTVRESFFDLFKASSVDSPGAPSAASTQPQAIVAIRIDVDGEEPQIVDLEEPEVPRPDRPPVETEGQSDADLEAIDLENIVGEAQSPLQAQSRHPNESVLPRPIEITWPQTESLGHCLGMRISIKIEVGADGKVLSVRPASQHHPSDCVEAALDAARRIKFLPGRVSGEPARMWTEVRIDFLRTRR